MNKKPLILTIDDTAAFREIFAMKLTSMGFDVVEAASGREGIEKLKTIKPDLILCDIEMPGMNGIETLEKLKENPETKDIRVVFLTSFGESEAEMSHLDKKFAKEIGAMDYIRKTDDLDKIAEQIKRDLSPVI